MIKGLYSAVTAMLTNSRRQQILSHNVSNMDTPGFKQILSTVEEFTHTQAVDPMNSINAGSPLRELGVLGLGVQKGLDSIDFTQGGLKNTNNPLDVGISGSAFFHIKTPEGDRYTRDGRFIRNENGELVTPEGYYVIGKGGQNIKLADGDVDIRSDGAIAINGLQTSQLDLVEFENPIEDLEHDQGGIFLAKGTPKASSTSTVVQGALESSNVSSAQLMAQMIEISRAYEAAQQMVQNQDELLGKTISSLGTIG